MRAGAASTTRSTARTPFPTRTAPSGGRGFNKVRGARVVARAKAFLDEAAPLAHGSHAPVLSYAVEGGKLVATHRGGHHRPGQPGAVRRLSRGRRRSHRHPAAPPRPAHRAGDRPYQPDRRRRPGGRVRHDPRIRHHHHHGLRRQRRRRGCGRQGRGLPQLARPDGRQPHRQLREGRQDARAPAEPGPPVHRAGRQHADPGGPQPDAGPQCRPPHVYRRPCWTRPAPRRPRASWMRC